MDPHEALLVALVALTMATDIAKRQVTWNPLSLPSTVEEQTLQPPCLDASVTAACALTLAN